MSIIFDVNCMVGKSGAPRPDWPAASDETAAELQRVGIDRALAGDYVSLQVDPVDGVEHLARQVGCAPDVLVGCPAAVPHWGGDVPGPKELLDAYLDRGWRAFRIYPRAHYFLFHPVVIGPLLEEAQARRFTVLINADQFDWPELIRVLESFGELKLVVCNEGYRNIRTIIPLLERFSELRFETSWMQQFLMYETIVGRVGPRRLLFGTQFPTFEPGAALTQLLRADLRDEDRRRVLGENLEAMLAEAR